MEKLVYNIGFIFGKILYYLIFSFFYLIYNGIVKASKKFPYFIIIYSLLLFASLASFSYGLETEGSILILVFTSIVLLAGFYIFIQEYPMRKARKYFNGVFKELNFKARNDTYPYYLGSKQVTDYALELTFHSIIPLSEWQRQKENLELYFNQKIMDIKQGVEDNRETHITIKVKELPERIDWNEYYNHSNTLVIGEGINGICELNFLSHPHAFICGETGCGKSNIMKCLIHQCLVKEYDVKLIDFKRGVSFSYFSDVIDIYYEYNQALQLLNFMVWETNRRLDLFRKNRVDNIHTYNQKNKGIGELKTIVIFIDELAELLKTHDKELSNILYGYIETLTRLSRAAGIHLIMGIQRPDSTIINGQIKNNVSFRLCGRFVDKEPSRIVLGNEQASTLPNIKGRFLVRDNDIQEIQCFYISDGFLNANYKKDVWKAPKKECPRTLLNEVETEKDIPEDIEVKDGVQFDFSDI